MIQKEAWHLEAEKDLELSRALQRVKRGDVEATLKALQILLRSDRKREALELLGEYMEDSGIPLEAKYEFMHAIQNLPHQQDEEEDMDWFVYHAKDEYDEGWFFTHVAKAMQEGSLSPTSSLAKKMWEQTDALPGILPWDIVEQTPEEWLPKVGFSIIKPPPEAEELRELREQISEGGLELPALIQAVSRVHELESDPAKTFGFRGESLPLKDLVNLIRNEYEVPEHFNAQYVKKDDPQTKLSLGAYLGFTWPIYKWVSESGKTA